jgi:DNA polymerase III epsilon subunit-like protein
MRRLTDFLDMVKTGNFVVLDTETTGLHAATGVQS